MRQWTTSALLVLALAQACCARPRARKEVGVLHVLQLQPQPSALPLGARVELALAAWNRREQKCSGTQFWFLGRCHNLNGDFRYCDKRNELVVLEKPEDPAGPAFPVKPVCAELRCPRDSVWWPARQECLKDEAARELCGELGAVARDVFGDAFCKCNDISANLAEGEKCYSLFHQGPCKVGEILEPRDMHTSLGKCAAKLQVTVSINKEHSQKRKDEAPIVSNKPNADNSRDSVTQKETRKPIVTEIQKETDGKKESTKLEVAIIEAETPNTKKETTDQKVGIKHTLLVSKDALDVGEVKKVQEKDKVIGTTKTSQISKVVEKLKIDDSLQSTVISKPEHQIAADISKQTDTLKIKEASAHPESSTLGEHGADSSKVTINHPKVSDDPKKIEKHEIIEISTVVEPHKASAVSNVAEIPKLSDIPKISQTGNIAEVKKPLDVPTVIQVSKISEESKVPEVLKEGNPSDVAEVSKEALKATDVLKTAEVSKVAENPKVPDVPKATEDPKVPEVPKVAEVPKEVEVQKITDVPKVAEVPKVTYVTKGVEAQKVTDISRVAEVPKVADFPKLSEAPKATETVKTPEVPKTTDSSKVSEVPAVDTLQIIKDPIKSANTQRVGEAIKAAENTKMAEVPKVEENRDALKVVDNPKIAAVSQENLFETLKTVESANVQLKKVDDPPKLNQEIKKIQAIAKEIISQIQP